MVRQGYGEAPRKAIVRSDNEGQRDGRGSTGQTEPTNVPARMNGKGERERQVGEAARHSHNRTRTNDRKDKNRTTGRPEEEAIDAERETLQNGLRD
jgi:hypothetical protein